MPREINSSYPKGREVCRTKLIPGEKYFCVSMISGRAFIDTFLYQIKSDDALKFKDNMTSMQFWRFFRITPKSLSFEDLEVGETYKVTNLTKAQEYTAKFLEVDVFGYAIFEGMHEVHEYDTVKIEKAEKKDCESRQILNLSPILKLEDIELGDILIAHKNNEDFFPITVAEKVYTNGRNWIISKNRFQYLWGDSSYRFYHTKGK